MPEKQRAALAVLQELERAAAAKFEVDGVAGLPGIDSTVWRDACIEMVTDQYEGEGGTLALIDGPIAGPETFPVADADGTPVTVCGAEGNVITAGLNPLTSNPINEVEMSFSGPIDYFSILAIDNEEGVTVVGYRDGEVVASTSAGVYVCDYPGSPVGGYFRGPVPIYTLGSVGGGVTFDRVMLQRVGGDMTERFDNLQFNLAQLHVDIDILPDEEPNCYNLNGRGSFPVLVFGNDTVGVEDIDPTSVTHGGHVDRDKKEGQSRRHLRVLRRG